MPTSQSARDRKEYFISCLLAVGCGALGLAAPGQGISSGMILVGLVAVIIVVAAAYRMGRPSEDENDEEDESVDDRAGARRRRMAMLWYALAIVLAAARVRDPLGRVTAGRGGTVSAVEWVLAAVGVAVVVFAAVRVWRMLPRSGS